MTRTRTSVLLTTLLVVASLTAGVSGVGTAYQAQDDGVEDETVESGEVYWEGQFLAFSAGAENASEVWEVREVSDGDVGGLVTEVLLDGSGSATVGTSGLDGEYVILNEAGDPVAFENGTATGQVGVNQAAWEVASQTLEASFSDVAVSNDDSADAQTQLELESNRAGYDFQLFSDNLTSEQLADVFSDVELQDGEAVSTRNTSDSAALEANFSGVEPGTYTVAVASSDGAARDSATITVSEPVDGTVSLANATVSEQRGDVARFNLTFEGTDRTTVTLGSENVGYLARFDVVDEDEDGEATVEVNTYQAGLSADDSGISAVGEDRVEGYQLQTDPVPDRLDAATYPIRTFAGGEQTTTGSLILNEPSIDGVQVWTAPGAESPETASELADVVTQDDDIAADDWAVIQIQASGVYGYVENISDLNDNETGLSMTLMRGMEMNIAETEVPIDNATMLADEENDQLFLVFDAADFDRDTSYGANFTVTEANPYVSADNASSYTANFSVVERTASIDEPLEVAASSDATVSGTSSVAPGTDLEVQVESTGANPFFERQTVTVEEGGTWEASFDLSGVPNGTEFTASVADPAANATGVVVTDDGAEDAEETETTEAEETDEEETTTEETTTEDDADDEEETTAEDEADAEDETQVEDDAEAETTTDEDAEDEDAADEGDEADETTTEDEVAVVSAPGFGPVALLLAGVLALAGAALATRRR
ncbi:DUF7827 domain-containing protein [Halorussus amylolyticus]|uniref:DUF7827 domain-containing protein n=1 Tax=Halorussus amylolyticus TaxID=1126242 RepID=UPI00104DDD68|nr:BGTF surface domain-containing protein [Halorussus amylolyticus]